MKPKIEAKYSDKTSCFELLKLFSKDSVKIFYRLQDYVQGIGKVRLT